MPKPDCCWDYLNEAKWVSRATWVCPACGNDVSLMYFLYMTAVHPELTTHSSPIEDV